jgi:hypothetical protein
MSDTPIYELFFACPLYQKLLQEIGLNPYTQCFQPFKTSKKIRDIPKVSREGKPPQIGCF